jgi:hypothetical protein
MAPDQVHGTTNFGLRISPGSFTDVLGQEVDDTSRCGVIGTNAAAGDALGILGGNDLVFGQHTGVYGESTQQGVMGLSTSPGGTGVYGGNTEARNAGIGVRGETANGVGIQGQSFGPGLAAKFIGSVDVAGVLTVNGVELNGFQTFVNNQLQGLQERLDALQREVDTLRAGGH